MSTQVHLLSTLSLPSRWEPLVSKIGPEVLTLLLPPAKATIHVLEEAADAVQSLAEGLFLPIHAAPGTGKTTLAENVTVFLPGRYTKTLTLSGEVSRDNLAGQLAQFRQAELASNDERVVPINIDQREGRRPSSQEVAEIKGFLRNDGRRALILWPETDGAIAADMAAAYRKVAGIVPLPIPISIDGPSRDKWTGLAAQTLQLSNGVDSLEYLIDLEEYDPEAYPSLGDYFRQIAFDFNKRRLQLERATRLPVKLTVLWVSESVGHGILSSLTSSRRLGMLDPSALLQACAESAIGKWWAEHRGLLVQTIVTLDAHVLGVSPSLSVAVMRRYGGALVSGPLKAIGVNLRSPREIDVYLKRSDLGFRLDGVDRSVGEGRGNPAADAQTAFSSYASANGFNGGKDKLVNRAFAAMLQERVEDSVVAETAVPFLPSLIPDVTVQGGSGAHCLEFTYRKGTFLESKNRSTIAQYCLTKLKGYATAMGWVGAGE